MRRWQKGRFAEWSSAKLESWTSGTLRFAASLLAILAIQLVGAADAFAEVSIAIAKDCVDGTATSPFEYHANFGSGPDHTNPTDFARDCAPIVTPALPAKPGANQVHETVPAGWELVDVTCDVPIGVTATVDVDLGIYYQLKISNIAETAAGDHTIHCVFTNLQSAPPSTGQITVTKVAPGGMGVPFHFSSTQLGSFFVVGGGNTPHAGLAEGWYVVTEDPLAGWSSAGPPVCTPSAGSYAYGASNTAIIYLAAGGTVSCVFTNTRTQSATGEIIVEKVVYGTDPNPGGTRFTFTDNFPGGSHSHTLRSGDYYTSGQIPVGVYRVTENVPAANWTLALQCRDSAGAIVGTTAGSTATVRLAAGQRITCTFTNTWRPSPSNRGHIIVRKVTTPSSTKQFCFESNLQKGDFSLANGGRKDFGPLRSGTYWVEEFPDSPWHAQVDCESELGLYYNIWYPSDKRAEITLVDGDTVTCTFTNTR